MYPHYRSIGRNYPSRSEAVADNAKEKHVAHQRQQAGTVWEDKKTGKRCLLLYVSGGQHWYQIPEWNGPQPCESRIFLDAMRPVLE